MNIRNLLKLVIISGVLFSFQTSCESGEVDCEETIWYQDIDNDGLGNEFITKMACEQPEGYVANKSDSFNENELVIPTTGYDAPASYDGYTLTWADEFNEETLNETFWNVQLGDGCPDLCGWGNAELQYYTDENITFTEGNMVITAKKESRGSKAYTSSRINTEGKFTTKYGRIDVRAVSPGGKGIWPAVWMLGENIREVGWPKCGEIDIMEVKGSNTSEVLGTVHWDNANSYANYGGSKSDPSISLSGQYYVYSITWDEQFIRWYLNGEEFHVIDITPAELDEFQKDFHLLINLAVGGNFDGDPDVLTKFPQHLIVDYIRVYQKND